MLLFTYGSLRKGQYNHTLLVDGKATYIGDMKIRGEVVKTPYRFPAMKEGLGLAVGEVYDISDTLLARLDSFEGNPTFYQRRTVYTTDGIPVEVYFGTGVINLPPIVAPGENPSIPA